MTNQKESISIQELSNVGTGEIRLPGGIVVDGVLHKNVRLREMSGYEEDIFADRRKAHGGDGKLLKSGATRISEILARCTVSIGDVVVEKNENPETAEKRHFIQYWSDACCGDRSFALVSLRRMSLGDSYVYTDVCPQCRCEIPGVTVDLSTLSVYPFFRNVPKEQRDELLLSKEPRIEKVSKNCVVEWHLLSGNDEDAISTATQNDKDIPSLVLAKHLTLINGAPATLERVKSLRVADRDYLKRFFDTVEGGVDTLIETQCSNSKCEHTFRRSLNMARQSFFFPSVT